MGQARCGGARGVDDARGAADARVLVLRLRVVAEAADNDARDSAQFGASHIHVAVDTDSADGGGVDELGMWVAVPLGLLKP